MKRFIFIFVACILLASCEEIIHIDLDRAESRIVIEGKISNDGRHARVTISRTTDYFAPGEMPPVSGAAVLLENDRGEAVYLDESESGRYHSGRMISNPGDKYTLTVISGGNTYIASSTMPLPVQIDSLTREYLPGGPFSDPGYFVRAYFSDPPETRNYYRLRTYINGTGNSHIHLFDDRLSNGLSLQYFFFNQSYQEGDTATVELHTIGFESYDYLLTLASVSAANQGGPGMTPANPNTNFSNGALGYFSAYTVSRKSLIIQKKPK